MITLEKSAERAELSLEERMMQLDLVNEALDQLRGNLSDKYYYHNLQHTLTVIKSAIRLGELAQLPERDIELLAIAAAWHDTGFIHRREKNEEIGANLAKMAMERVGRYTEGEIADVVSAIRSTEVTFEDASAAMIQMAHGRLSEFLLDADLSHFGAPGLLRSSLCLLKEFTGLDVLSPKDLRDPRATEFIAGTVRMLNRHNFQRQESRLLLAEQKSLNYEVLSNLLANIIGGTDESLRLAWESAAY
jgi:predicted metal-dependent HD superfamily phosphohydrolase